MNGRVLFVDDERSVLAGFRRNLCQEFGVELAASAAEALAWMEQKGPPEVVVADMRMPEMTGTELLAEVHRRWPDTVRVMLTGTPDQQTAIQAVNRGQVFRFLTKPCALDDLAGTLRLALEQHRLVRAERELLDGTLNGTVTMLSEVLALVEPSSFGRSQKVRVLVHQLAGQLGLGARWDLEIAGLLSELGWITVPPELVVKVRAGTGLTSAEAEVVARVPELGANLLSRIPRMGDVAEFIRHQDLRFEVEVPQHSGASVAAIPLGARILKVAADLVRLEAEGLSRDRALDRMQRRIGWYDPRVLAATFECLDIQQTDPRADAHRVVCSPLDELYPGCILLQDVHTLQGVLIVTSGTQITAPLLNRLRNFASTAGVIEPIKVRIPGTT